jgi:hypothetical protein
VSSSGRRRRFAWCRRPRPRIRPAVPEATCFSTSPGASDSARAGRAGGSSPEAQPPRHHLAVVSGTERVTSARVIRPVWARSSESREVPRRVSWSGLENRAFDLTAPLPRSGPLGLALSWGHRPHNRPYYLQRTVRTERCTVARGSSARRRATSSWSGSATGVRPRRITRLTSSRMLLVLVPFPSGCRRR